tara:strand:+ start:18164 stop:18793 length:630 start_codon:yes stop_codon:yes gene_type:complete
MINSVSSFNKITPSENFIVKNASDLPIIRNKFTHYPENYAGEKIPLERKKDDNLSFKELVSANKNDLQDALFHNNDFSGLDLSGVNFTKSSFRDADLTGTILINADLTRCNFRNANLTNADLTGAITCGANFRDADLTGAKLPDNCAEANFKDAKLKGAKIAAISISMGDFADLKEKAIEDFKKNKVKIPTELEKELPKHFAANIREAK